jgi:hypothetical protein
MSVIYHNLSRLSAEREASAKYVSLKELIPQSDVISLNLALNESTRNIIGEAEFAEKKRGVLIVNTARSGLVLLRFTCQMAVLANKLSLANTAECSPKVQFLVAPSQPSFFNWPKNNIEFYSVVKIIKLASLSPLPPPVPPLLTSSSDAWGLDRSQLSPRSVRHFPRQASQLKSSGRYFCIQAYFARVEYAEYSRSK